MVNWVVDHDAKELSCAASARPGRRSLRAGTYRFAITDKSSLHNFTLERETGLKIEKHLSGTAFTGTKTTTVTLKRGKWKYYCSVHESQMFGFIKVTM